MYKYFNVSLVHCYWDQRECTVYHPLPLPSDRAGSKIARQSVVIRDMHHGYHGNLEAARSKVCMYSRHGGN